MQLTSSMAALNSVENPSQLAFFRLNRLLDALGSGTITGFTVTHIGRGCVRGMGSRTDFSHISKLFDDTNMRSALYLFFHIALLNDFGSFALCMSDSLFGSAHCSTDSPSLFVVVYPHMCTEAIDISYYNVSRVSLFQNRESEWLRWWFVHGVYNNIRYLHCNEFNFSLFINRNVVHLQTLVKQNCRAC